MLEIEVASLEQELEGGTCDLGLIKKRLLESKTQVRMIERQCLDALPGMRMLSLLEPSRNRAEELQQRLQKLLASIDGLVEQVALQDTPLHRLSLASGKAIQQLTDAGEKLTTLGWQVDVLDALVANGNVSTAVKSQLVQLETEAKRLETDGVDSVCLSEVNSGRSVAKSLRRGELLQLEQLFAKMDAMFQKISAIA